MSMCMLVVTVPRHLMQQARMQGYDQFCYAHPNFLPFVAAGNFGGSGLDSSVSTPSTAKNAMSVGVPD